MIIIGKTLSAIENSYIQINDQLWSTNCPLRALSYVLKLTSLSIALILESVMKRAYLFKCMFLI